MKKECSHPGSTYYSLNYSFYFICLAKTELHVYRQTFASSCYARRCLTSHTVPAHSSCKVCPKQVKEKKKTNKRRRKSYRQVEAATFAQSGSDATHNSDVPCRAHFSRNTDTHRHTLWFLALVGRMSSNGLRSSYNVIDRKRGILLRPDASLSCTDASPTFPLQSHRISEAYIKRFHFLCISRLCYNVSNAQRLYARIRRIIIATNSHNETEVQMWKE